MGDPFAAGRRVHVIGVAGAGMSALALLLHEAGCVVSGCDQASNAATSELRALGLTIYEGHDESHLANVDVVTATPAVSVEHVELLAARRQGVRVLTRADVMGELTRRERVVGVTGTHGKTTTTSMAVQIWRAGARDPSWLVGAPVTGLGAPSHYRAGGDLLVEVDESFGTFAQMSPASLGLLNIDPDHLDFYGDLATLETAFSDLIERTNGPVVIWADHDGAARVARRVRRQVAMVGTSTNAGFRVSAMRFEGLRSHFVLYSPVGRLEITLEVPGALNVANAALAAALALSNDVSPDAVRVGLGNFRGAPRRFELLGTLGRTVMIDDYAHLPNEVAATLAAARASGFAHIVAVFQPHRVTRTAALASSFAGAFDAASAVVVTDIYAAGEPNPDGVTGEVVANAVRHGDSSPPVLYGASLHEAAALVRQLASEADLVVLLGAGDVRTVATILGVI